MLAGLLVAARSALVGLGLPSPSVEAIVAATGATRTRAYDLSAAIVAVLPTLGAPRGRPPKPKAAPSHEAADLTGATLAYVMRHPGCVHRDDERQHYSDTFRHFVLEQYEAHAALDIEVFAACVRVPLGTLKDWLALPTKTIATALGAPAKESGSDVGSLHVQTVIAAWTRWEGSFLGFCDHVREHLRVPFGRSLVRRILEAHGLRRTSRRKGRSPDESALRGAFKTFFPGGQWVGDGMQVPVVVDGKRFLFNFELNVDAHTDAFVGISVRDAEDEGAVIEAFGDGIATTGARPLALLLDNRPSNHTPEVDATLDDTIRIRATLSRPQNKAHVEGAFGLFSQVLPPLVLDTKKSAHHLARSFLGIVTTLWARTTNHRPRHDRRGRSRAELYADAPSDSQIDLARRELREIADRQERARRTLEARRRPEILTLLDNHFSRLALLDPERHIRIAIAGHPLDAIVDGIAIFEGKRLAHTLPDGADARYLLGIVANVAAQAEGAFVARRLLELRLEVRDHMLHSLVRQRDAIFALRDVTHACRDCVDEALVTTSPLVRTFWLDALATAIRRHAGDHIEASFSAVARRIHTTFAVPLRERHDAVRAIAERLVPLT